MQHPSNRYCPAAPEIPWGAGFPCVAEISWVPEIMEFYQTKRKGHRHAK